MRFASAGTCQEAHFAPKACWRDFSKSAHLQCSSRCNHRVALARCLSRSTPSVSACPQAASDPATAAQTPSDRTFDVVALGNLCLDIIVSVPELPPSSEGSRRKLLRELTAAPPPRSAWEVGANANFLIAAARLGLRVASVGHIGPDQYGDYIRHVLQVTLPFCLMCKHCACLCFDCITFSRYTGRRH